MEAEHGITEQLLALRGSDDPAAWERLVAPWPTDSSGARGAATR